MGLWPFWWWCRWRLGRLCGLYSYAGHSLCSDSTSLTAQVDSSIGGKTGVNTPFAKNMVGTFANLTVLISSFVLETFSEKESWLKGWGWGHQVWLGLRIQHYGLYWQSWMVMESILNMQKLWSNTLSGEAQDGSWDTDNGVRLTSILTLLVMP